MGNGKNMGEIKHARRIDLDWRYNVHVIEFAYLDPYYMKVEPFSMPNNALIIMELTNEYVLIHTTDDGDFMERFETFEELDEYLRREFGLVLNKPEQAQQK
jgi:hypothetical protein